MKNLSSSILNILKESTNNFTYNKKEEKEIVANTINYITNEYNEITGEDKSKLLNILRSNASDKAKINTALLYIVYGYDELELGSDDRYFLYNRLDPKRHEREEAKEREADEYFKKKRQEEKDRLAKQREERELKGITTYSLRGKKQDVLNSLKDNLGPDFYVREPGIDGILTIKRNGSNSGIRGYLQNKTLPDDRFGLVFEPVISSKIKDKMTDIYNMGEDYDVEIGQDTYTGKSYKLKDIPKLVKEIKKIL